MTTREELLAELIEMKNAILDDNTNLDKPELLLQKIEAIHYNSKILKTCESHNIIKSFLITFNVNNFSDFTVLFVNKSDNIEVIEYAGDENIYKEFNYLIESDRSFYKDIEKIKINSDKFRLLYESMEIQNSTYIILTITESELYKPSKFHMLADIIMEIIRCTDKSHDSVFNDLFEETETGLFSFFSENISNGLECYLFKFENIYDFFLKTGLEIIIELSDTIYKKLNETFENNSQIFRLSLSRYLILSKSGISHEINNTVPDKLKTIDFNFKGIILQYQCLKINLEAEQSIYDIFEKLYLINNS